MDKHTISGKIVLGPTGNRPLSGITVKLTTDTGTLTTRTHADGTYSFTNVPSGVVTASSNSFTFSPARFVVSDNDADVGGINFMGTRKHTNPPPPPGPAPVPLPISKQSISNIDYFKEKIKAGLARPNRYLVQIMFPLTNQFYSQYSSTNDVSQFSQSVQNGLDWSSTVKLGIMHEQKMLSILCEHVELPGVHIATQEDKQFGPTRKMPYMSMFNELTIGFICDKDMYARTMFDQWQACVINKFDFSTFFYEDYIATVNITLLSEQNKPIYCVQCFEAYPIEVISQPLSYGENDTYLKLEVKMAYRYWDMSDTIATAQIFSLPSKRPSGGVLPGIT